MSAALVAAGLWLVLAGLAALWPPGERGWGAWAALVAAGVPLLGWLTLAHGPVAGVLALAGGAALLGLAAGPRRPRRRGPQDAAE